ncbi:hypothetical protein HanIR_Chr07g0318081 [Helianthus annuus]|nr:hypothetical protein HanIR_Chr07g0318081 [Helianthus annuus]
MGIFSGDRGNLLEEIYATSAPTGVKSGKVPRRVDISKITPPASPPPPSRTIGLSPPRDDLGEKEKGGDVNVEHKDEGGDDAGGDCAGGADGDDKGKGFDTEMESSETTPHQTIYTKRPRGGGGGATSCVARSPQFENIRADSWDTRNPACDDLPHAPRWNLTQGSQMNDLENCHDFFSLSLPLLRRCFRKNAIGLTCWMIMFVRGLIILPLLKRLFASGDWWGRRRLSLRMRRGRLLKRRKSLMLRRKGCNGGFRMLSKSLRKRNKSTSKSKKDWEFACERTHAEMQSQLDAIVRLSGEKKEISEEAQQARVAFEKKEKEYVERLAKLEKLAKQKVFECEAAERLLEEKASECKASELLVEEASADWKWLLSRAVPLIADRIVNSHELASYMFELGQAGYNSGRKDGYSEGRAAAVSNEKEYHFELFKEDYGGKYAAKRKEFASLEFAVVKAAQKLSRKSDGVALLKKALGDESHAAGGVGTSHPE